MRLNRRYFERRIHGMMAGCRLLVLSGIVLGAVGCGGASVVRDFSLSAGAAVALTAGGATQQVTVTVTAISGFSSPVTVTLSGLPARVTAAPASLSATPGAAGTFTLTAAASAAASSSTVTVMGVSGTLTHTASFALSVKAAPADFSLTVNPTTVNITGGAASAGTAIAVTAINGFSSGVSIALSGLPSGVTAAPASLTITPGTPQSVTLTAAASVAASSSTITVTGTFGTLTHTTTFKLNVAAAPPPADFSLAIKPTSLTLTTGALGQQTAVTATALNGFSGSVSVSVSGLPTGVTVAPTTLTLTPGTAQSLTLTAAANAAVGGASVTINGQSGTLSHSATLALTVAAPSGHDVTTYHDDNSRTGLNPNETILTTTNVSSATFGKLNLVTMDGVVDAEPLYLSAVTIKGQTHNALYVVTENDSVYAVDADNGTQLWKVSALGSGETTSDDHGCGQITPQIGITSTPVIDRQQGANGTIFVVAMTKDAKGAYHQRLHALDMTTGAEIAGSPTEITGSYPGTGDSSSGGMVSFLPGQYAERAGLLLMNHTIYLGWTSHCDARPYTGWVMAYSETSLKQTAILNMTPNGNEGSVWMAGAGLAGDTSGNVYFLDANGTLDAKDTVTGFPVNGDYGNAMVKLSTTNNSLTVDDFFETYNSINESNNDVDLGSGGALLLPDVFDSGGTVHHLMVGAGKDSNIYVGDRDNLGKYNAANNNALYQELSGALPGGVWSMPAYFNYTVYYGGVGDNLKAFTITNAKLGVTPSSQSAATFAYPGATPSVSANGTSNGIVWALESATGSTAVLYAYDATNLTKELYNSTQASGSRDGFGTGNKFITPMIANGKVYVGTPTGVAIFGLLP
jgi:outer membrane protein assembly factor BamB